MTGTLTISDIALDAIQRYPDADNPSAFLAVNQGNSYHTLRDTPDKVEYERLARVVTGLHGMLRDLAQAPPRE